MAVVNYAKKELAVKIVYYGPSLCGKTTSLQYVHANIAPEQKGKLVSLATEGDRTLFFDFLPIEMPSVKGFKTRLHFYTVPGQIHYNATRKAVLTGVDGVVFVADSQRDSAQENSDSLKNLEENLNYYGKSIKTIPLVFQYNKRDLMEILSVAEMNQMLNPYQYPYFESIATTGEGVLKILTAITKMVLRNINKGTREKPESLSEEIPFSIEKAEYQPPGPTQRTITEPQKQPLPGIAQESMAIKVPEYKPIPISKEEKRERRVQIIEIKNAEIISENVIRLPVRLKFGGDDIAYLMNIDIRLEKILKED